MTISVFSTSFSEGVANENEVNKKGAEESGSTLARSATLDDYYFNSNAPSEYAELVKILPDESMKILDVGVGRGESSLFLSSLGHFVFAVEPSEHFCQLIESAAGKFGVTVNVCQGVAEDMDRLGETGFDVVFFNSSLHHCDDSLVALRHSYDLLRPGGYIFLVSELFIRPWVSKASFYRRLETHPVEMGHYGGNEHAYYNWEYRTLLLKSGFENLQLLPMASTFSPLDHLSSILSIRIDGERKYSEIGVLMRAVYYILTARVLRIPLLFQNFSLMSLVAANFFARKPL